MATQFPSNYASFGLVNETGVLTDSISWAYTQDSKEIRNGTGDIIGKAYYNEKIEVSVAGFIPTTTPFASTLAAVVSLVTSPTDYLKGSLGSHVVESITRTHANEEYQRIEFTAMNYPLLVTT